MLLYEPNLKHPLRIKYDILLQKVNVVYCLAGGSRVELTTPSSDKENEDATQNYATIKKVSKTISGKYELLINETLLA